jgi:hypothetical protein
LEPGGEVCPVPIEERGQALYVLEILLLGYLADTRTCASLDVKE